MSSARKSYDTDIITLRKINIRGDSNADIPSSFVLMSDGVGGTSWTNTSTITHPVLVGQNNLRGTQQQISFDTYPSPVIFSTSIDLTAPKFYSVNIKGELFTENYQFTSSGVVQLRIGQSQGQTSSPSIYLPYNTYAGYIDDTKRNNISINYTTILQTQTPWNSTLTNTLQITASTLSTASIYKGLNLKIDQVLAQELTTYYQFP
jgi:hypothetical protein